MTDEVPQGIDTAAITAWLSERVEVQGPLRFERIAGGQSNLTYRVSDDTGLHWVLRRPPLGQVLATAHDMGRESRIIAALAPTDVPVAPLVGASLDDSINGAPFYVMDFVAGHVIRGEAEAAGLSLQARAHAGEQIVDVMARIHAVDVDAVGLGDLGRREAYIARQLKRWYGQWHKSKSREIPAVDTVHDALLAAIPEQGSPAIVHGDYRLDNCLLTDDGDVAAVLDWEICTLGDPLADLGLLVVYWGEDSTGFSALPGSATRAEGFPPASAMIDRYAAASGRDVSQIDFYVAFGYWKLACILEGVYARYRGGAMGQTDSTWELFAKQVEMLADAAAATVERMNRTG
ncbi:MAG TPA: phosphotransferase family protein [Iamia sp.]|nr:phosphotransferase family protein [Iamia sp.]